MKKINLLVFGALIFLSLSVTFAQRWAKSKPALKPRPIIFAVVNDGKTLEPIGEIDKGKLVETGAEGSESRPLASFVATYYKPKTTYNLIFGAAVNGTITIKNSSLNSDCAKNQADVNVQSTKAKLGGFVMGLATNQKPAKDGSGLRRLPTPIERSEIESLVRAEFSRQGVSANSVKEMKYYNLTALDVDNDGKAEIVGSFWTENAGKERYLLFFIAGKNAGGRYEFGYSDYKKVSRDDVMSGDLKDLDELGGELLLDAFEYDGDSTAEIFTIGKAFEGSNFYVYSRRSGKWTKIFESYNYHCAY